MPNITFLYPDGASQTVSAETGMSILEISRQHKIPLEGACEGSLACSTCHVVIDEAFIDLLPAAAEEEEDMLDLAFGLTETSRLGCQIHITDELDGIIVRLPAIVS